MFSTKDHIITYYTSVARDYFFWSRAGNMHFGFYRRGMNPFRLEPMLEQMNREVLRRLALNAEKPQRLLDMGCGLGATARQAARFHPNFHVTGLTLVPWQAEEGLRIARHEAIDSVEIMIVDFTKTPFPNGSFDAVYSLESACYAPGSGKWPLIREMYRILKPGGRFVVADALLKTERPMNRLTRACYRSLCEFWALDSLGTLQVLVRDLHSVGFLDVQVTNISKNVTPSVLHVPLRTIVFGIRELFLRPRELSPQRWRHLLAGLLLMIFTLDRTRSGYFMISGAKPS